jgi:hypothetical protein
VGERRKGKDAGGEEDQSTFIYICICVHLKIQRQHGETHQTLSEKGTGGGLRDYNEGMSLLQVH